MFPALYFFYFSSLIPLLMAAGPQCNPAEQSVSGKALKGHTYKSKRVQDPYECLVFCNNEVACQSYNYVITGKICELNDRTREEKPDDFVQDETRFYVRKWKTEVGPYQYLNQFTSRRYFKYLRRYRSITQRATQTTMSVLCRMFEAIHYGIALGHKR